MTDLDFRIEWLGAGLGGDASDVTFGALEMRAGDHVLTDVEDLLAKTTRNSIRVSLAQLAGWFADNWWRLRWEPRPVGGEPGPGWKMAHRMSAAGGGFVWPQMEIHSDGDRASVRVAATGRTHSVRYLSDVHVQIRAAHLELAVDRFVESVIGRQYALGSKDSALAETWGVVLEERRDPTLTTLRRREALMGLDPDEVPADHLAALFSEGSWLGAAALDEVLVGTPVAEAPSTLKMLREFEKTARVGFDMERVIEACRSWVRPGRAAAPWELGRNLAQHLRVSFGLGLAPVPDQFLCDLVGNDIHADGIGLSGTALGVAFRGEAGVRPALRSTPFPSSRRFDVARLVADVGLAPDDAVLPLTRTKTARQKFQRAAAQELLCPVDALRAELDLPDPDDDQVSALARRFMVHEQLVRSALVNHGLVPR